MSPVLKRALVYGALLTSSVAISLVVTVPAAAAVLAMRRILPRREPASGP